MLTLLVFAACAVVLPRVVAGQERQVVEMVAERFTFTPSRLEVAGQERQVVEMVAERFTFTPSRLEVTVGTTVEIHIRSADTDHGFHLVNGPNVIVPKRRHGDAVVVFEADSPGVYQFECSKLCGAGHNFMKGEIVVTASDDDS